MLFVLLINYAKSKNEQAHFKVTGMFCFFFFNWKNALKSLQNKPSSLSLRTFANIGAGQLQNIQQAFS